MSGENKLTVVTVVKNGACLLEETILSVIEQKVATEIDYIIIDGGSTDGSTDIIRKYVNQISYWVSEQDNGIYDAMNKGWSAAADESFILFLGAGDRLISLPATMSRYHQNDVVYGVVRMGDQTIFIPRADFHLKLYNALHHQAVMVNKSLHPDPPFNCSFRVYADFDFNQRLKKSGVQFVYSSEFIGYAHPGGVSDRNSLTESLRIVSKNYGYMWAALVFSAYCAMQLIPFLKRLRPIRTL
jgi:glycosyltransferase involved in cell wall biosynthesis